MEEIYVNTEYDYVHSSPSTNQTGPRSSDRRCHEAVVLFPGLLSVFLLAGLIVLSGHYYNSAHGAAAELSTIKANLTELLQDCKNKVSSLTEERDQLNARLIKTAEELNRLQSTGQNNSLIMEMEIQNGLKRTVFTSERQQSHDVHE